MIHHIIISAIVSIAIVFAVVVYGKVLLTYMQEHAIAVGKDAQLQASTGWSWFLVKIMGWKTSILSFFAMISGAIAGIPADALQTIVALPTETLVADQKIAAWITTLIVTMIPLVHAQGVAQAAKTTPQDGE